MSENITSTVIEIGKINFRGTLIDDGWYNHITFDNGKPNLNAILILSEIIYWYRPTEIKDEVSGQLLGFRKKFWDDKLQKNYQALADRFGISKRESQNACIFLKKMDLITIEQRTIITKDGMKIPNVTFIEPITENVRKISCLYSDYLKSGENKVKVTYGTFKSDITDFEKSDRSDFQKCDRETFKSDTNTSTTTNTSFTDITPSINQEDKMDRMDNKKDYRDLIKKNIEYDLLKEDYPNEGLIDDIFENMVEVANSDSETIKVEKVYKPTDKVRSIFLKLNKSHVEYVIECYNNNTTKIKVMDSYLITTLYKSYRTINSYYTNRVNHDMANELQG